MLKLSTNRKRVMNMYVNTYPTDNVSVFANTKYGSIFTWMFWFCMGCLILLLISISFLQIYRSITTNKFFEIERINIHGTNLLSKTAILNNIDLQLGMNNFSVNISNIEKILNRNPCVKTVSVKRKLPGVIDIFITEHKSTFWLLKDGLMYYADRLGQQLALVEPDNFISLPTMEILDGGEQLLPILGDVVDTFQRISPIDIGMVSAFRLSASKGIEIIIEDHNLILTFGGNNWQKSLEWLCVVLSDLIKRNELKNTVQIIALIDSVCVIQ